MLKAHANSNTQYPKRTPILFRETRLVSRIKSMTDLSRPSYGSQAVDASQIYLSLSGPVLDRDRDIPTPSSHTSRTPIQDSILKHDDRVAVLHTAQTVHV